MTTSKKVVRTHHAVDPTLVAQAAGLAQPLPSVSAPKPPSNFDPAAKASLGRSLAPRRAQIDLAPNIAAEIKNGTQYTQLFSDVAPDPGTLAEALVLSNGWSTQVRSAEAWLAYARYEEQLAWQHTFSLTAALEPTFNARRLLDPGVATQYASLAKFYDLPKETAVKSAATRKANRIAEQKESATTTSGTVATTEPAKTTA